MRLKVMMVAHFCDEFDGKGNNRFNYLAKALEQQGVDVELITSSYSHAKKRPKRTNMVPESTVRVTLINEPEYQKNVSVRRFWAHRVMARNVRDYLARSERPDVVYCAVPSLAVADEVRAFCQRQDVPFVIDVQDLWPEAFYMVSSFGSLNDFLFTPLKRQADRIYGAADGIIAVSDRYLGRALGAKSLKSERLSTTLYLGTELSTFDTLVAEAKRYQCGHETNGEAVEFVYLGTLGHSYDLKTAINAFGKASERSSEPLKLTVIGDGPKLDEFKRYAQEIGVEVEFTGRVDYPTVVSRLAHCNVALNTITKGAAQSIINKHGDYAAAGLPVISTQECVEYSGLLMRYQAGINCPAADSEAVANAMVRLAESCALRNELGRGSRQMAEALFDRATTYAQIPDFLMRVCEASKPRQNNAIK